MKKVGLVILNYCGGHKTVKCIESINALCLDGVELCLAIVDNASKDDSVSIILSKFPGINLIVNDCNSGYAAGNNLGVASLLDRGIDAVWLLNNDTIVEADALVCMVNALYARPSIGAVGGAAMGSGRHGDTHAVIGGTISWLRGASRHVVASESINHLDYLSGASLLVRREAWTAVGGLCDKYFLYWEDADFCLRLKQCGWEIATVVEAKVRHEESSTLGFGSREKVYYMNREYVRFALRHAPCPYWTLFAAYLSRVSKSLLVGRWCELPYICRGMIDGWRGRNASYREMVDG